MVGVLGHLPASCTSDDDLLIIIEFLPWHDWGELEPDIHDFGSPSTRGGGVLASLFAGRQPLTTGSKHTPTTV